MFAPIERKIDKFARFLQQHNDLDHIAYLKIRLGLQIVVNNIAKITVVYGIALLLNIFLYTLITHIAFFLLRSFAHGAHAKSSLLCYIESIVLFLVLPWIFSKIDIPSIILYSLAFICFCIVCKYAPAATRKQPIPKRLRKGKHIKAIITAAAIIIISLFLEMPYPQLLILGLALEAISLLPIFFIKEV